MSRTRLGATRLLLLGLASLAAHSMPAAAGEKIWLTEPEVALPPIHRVVILRTEVVVDFEVRDSLVTPVDSLISSTVQDAGYEVIPGWVHRRVWEQVVDSLGGIFDPATGVIDPARAELADSLAWGAMLARYDPDAWVHPKLVVHPVDFSSGTAYLDHATDKVTTSGLPSVGEALFGYRKSGSVNAVSLLIEMQDRNRRRFFIHGAGIQVLQRHLKGKFVDVPVEERLAIRERVIHAVEETLKPFVKKTAELREKGRMGSPS